MTAAAHAPPFGAYMRIFTLELQKTLFYRFDFWIRAVAYPASRVFLAYFLWLSVFASTGKSEFGGYDFNRLMMYYVMASVIANVVITSPAALSDDIYQGTLTKYLLYPASFFGLKFFSGLGSGVVSMLQLVLVLLAVAAISPTFEVSASALILGMIACFAARTLCFVLTSITELVAFWADQVFNLWLMLYFIMHLLGGILLPPSLFPEWLRRINEFTPFPYLIAFPSRALTGEMSLAEWGQAMGMTLGWTAAGSLVCVLMFNRGLKRYAGVGM